MSKSPQTPGTARQVPPYFRCPWQPYEVSALQALAEGRADAEQQKLVLAWIVRDVSAKDEVSFFPGQADASAFMAGRSFVGKQLVMFVNLNLSTVIEANKR